MLAMFQITMLVPDYDQAIHFYVNKLGFTLIEDTKISDDQRWVVISASGDHRGSAIVLALPETLEESDCMGNQTANRVGFFLGTDDCQRDFDLYSAQGVEFTQSPQTSPYGTVAIFVDPFGNHWDLIEHVAGHRFALNH